MTFFANQLVYAYLLILSYRHGLNDIDLGTPLSLQPPEVLPPLEKNISPGNLKVVLYL